MKCQFKPFTNLNIFHLTFHVVAIRLTTFTYLPYSNVDPLDGTEIRVVKEFCRIYNCSITIIANDGNLWGTVEGDGKGEGN